MNISDLPVVFLVGVGRCGTYIVRACLDGHPQVLVIPAAMKIYRLWRDADLDRVSDPDELARIILTETKIVRFKDDAHFVALTGLSYDLRAVDWTVLVADFQDYLRTHGCSRRNVQLGLWRAYRAACGQDPSQVRLVLGDAVYDDFAAEILEDFPQARFLHVVRDHRSNVVSHKNYYLKNHGCLVYPDDAAGTRSILIHILTMQASVMRMLHRESARLGPAGYRAVTFEDLKLQPDRTLRSLADWLGVDFNDGMLDLTMAGQSFAGDSSFSDEPVRGLSGAGLTRWREAARDREVRLIETLFHDSLTACGYRPEFGPARGLDFWLAAAAPWRDELLYFGPRRNAAATARWKRLIRPFYCLAQAVPMYFRSRWALLRLCKAGVFDVTRTESSHAPSR